MATTTVTLNYGTSLSSGGNSGYRLAAPTAYSTRGNLLVNTGYPYKVTAVSVPWFGYSAARSNVSVSGTITVTIGSYKLTGTLSSTTLKTNTNVTGTVTCTGTAYVSSNTLYYLWVECSGSNLVKTGVRFGTNGTKVTVTYSPLTYTVSYSANGRGSAPAAQTKTAGTTLTLLPYIASLYSDGSGTITGNKNGGTWSGSNGSAKWRTTYALGGWNTNSAGTGTNYGSKGSYTANAGATLYAKWGSSTAGTSYTLPTGTPSKTSTSTIIVYFDANGNGASTSKTSQNSTKTSTYAFDGWYTAASGGTKRTTSSRVVKAETVYAHYSTSATHKASAVTLPTTSLCIWSGHVLLGWSTSSSATSATYSAGGSYTPSTGVTSVTLYAVWSTNSYTLTYEYDDGSTTQQTTGYNAVVSPPILTKPGYKFMGWGRTCSGTAHAGNFGYDMIYTNKIAIHLNGRMDDWSQYSDDDMRLISCCKTLDGMMKPGGWNISSRGSYIEFDCYDYVNGGMNLKPAISTVRWDSLSSGWHSFDIVFNGTNVKGYLDDELIATSSNYTNAPNGAIGYRVGSDSNIYLGAEQIGSTTTGCFFKGDVTAPLILNQSTKISKDDLRFVMPAGNWTIKPMWVRANHIHVATPNKAVTDLTTSTWEIEEKPNISSNFNYNINFSKENNNFTSFKVVTETGYDYKPAGTVSTLTNTEWWGIDGGSYPAISNLANTKWDMNESIDLSSIYINPSTSGNVFYSLNYTVDSFGEIETGTHFRVSKNTNTNLFSLVFRLVNSSSTREFYLYSNSRWLGSNGNFTILGGNDATNSNLINWFKQNGSMIFDISGIAGSTRFNLLQFTSNNLLIGITESDGSVLIWNNGVWRVFPLLITDAGSSTAEVSVLKSWLVENALLRYENLSYQVLKYNNTTLHYLKNFYQPWYGSRIITINGGSDSRNQDLIDWLYNNATLLGGGLHDLYWQDAPIYVLYNGKWKPAIINTYIDNEWQQS